MSNKVWARCPEGVVVEIIELAAELVPGLDIFTSDVAIAMRDVTEFDPRPEVGWTTPDAGASYVAPAVSAQIVPDRCSKLGLKRALAETGDKAVFPEPEWTAVKAALAADADLQEDWDLATEIRRSDPLTQAMITARQYTSAQVDALLTRANELVA